MEEGLQAILEKLRRAEQRLEDLAPSIEAWRIFESNGIVRDGNSHGGDGLGGDAIDRAEALHDRDPRVTWAVATGEILYNLRSALDQAAYRLSRPRRAPFEPPPGVGFPIFTSRKRFFRVTKRGTFRASSGAHMIRAMSHDAQAHVIAVQPYQLLDQAKSHPLALLDAFLKQDGREAPHIVAYPFEGSRSGPVAVRDPIVPAAKRALGASVEEDEGGLVATRRTGSGADGEADVRFAAGVAFAADGPAAGRPFPDTLFEIVQYVLEDVLRDRLAPLLT